MKYKKAFFNIVIIIHLLFWVIFLLSNLMQLNVFLSYEIAFFSILLVVFASYLNYKKLILKQSKKYEKNFYSEPFIFMKRNKIFPKIIHFKVIKDDLNLSFKDKIYFFSIFFNLFKLIAYIVLVAGFLFLHRQDNLNILAYICGISSLLICVFIFILYVKKYESDKNH